MKLSNENKVRYFTKLKPELQTQSDFRAFLINGVAVALLNLQTALIGLFFKAKY